MVKTLKSKFFVFKDFLFNDKEVVSMFQTHPTCMKDFVEQINVVLDFPTESTEMRPD